MDVIIKEGGGGYLGKVTKTLGSFKGRVMKSSVRCHEFPSFYYVIGHICVISMGRVMKSCIVLMGRIVKSCTVLMGRVMKS